MRAMPIVLPLAVLASAGTATDMPHDRNYTTTLAQATAGLAPGKPQTCLPNRLDTDLKVAGPDLIYRVSRTQVYVSHTNGGCENVAHGDALLTVSHEGQLCSGDIAQTVDQLSRFPTGSCALGDFVLYSKPHS